MGAKINQSTMCNNIIQLSIYKSITVGDVKMQDRDTCLYKIQSVVFTGTHGFTAVIRHHRGKV